ncbi:MULTISPECIES: alcohol dehydrogenase catalytic domain-containing protein [unclassified Frondihabitans]|jgi:threonine dehydrogenase-like Zn-dependent dehydrogenase|uniref:alcohol dehydrogenase catalytic domain-containing protein n=1 Tax=unclassified Frondihabitans TaxID=2626248 RepID=UPI0006FA1241|nr:MULTISPECIES: alcohol dehydrogenase catalytic domain-containing protein [unclassified Frondihabitans]KQQ25435.1 molecular chaperone GroES [Frondihabitans sp. Leaf304]RPE77915.1 threonine dehydrogenase-like Zn-dependent dehydrogenase [Frondihabitans sp. PhB153]RPF08195.1 threonine dehydrogenase-like Zn-dependent dehydrogenase [Frondihabitans sp. PhB161]
MRALTYQAVTKVSVEEVPDPTIIEPTDAVIRVTSAAICGSDLHLYDALGPYLDKGDVLGHETMGVVTAVGTEVSRIKVGDRVVVPFVIACGHCFMCDRGLFSQCETTQVTEYDSGATLYGFSKLYGQTPGGQAEQLRIQRADFNLITVGATLPDERYLFLSDILPTAWQGVEYAEVPDGGTLVVLGLGPVGQFASRIGVHKGYRVIAVDPVPERRTMAERHGVETLDLTDDVSAIIKKMTDDRGPDSVLDAVGMEAHEHGAVGLFQKMAGVLPDAVGQAVMQKAGIDSLGAMHLAFDVVRRGGTVSLSGVYGGTADPTPFLNLFDKQISLRMGQCNVQKWTETLMPLVEDPADPLGTEDLVTHPVPLEQAAEMYDLFKTKGDGCIKVVLKP